MTKLFDLMSLHFFAELWTTVRSA